MKKLILIALAAVVMAGCGEKINGITLEEGDTKTYETKEYLIIYKIEGFNGFGQTIWRFDKIVNKKDSL